MSTQIRSRAGTGLQLEATLEFPLITGAAKAKASWSAHWTELLVVMASALTSARLCSFDATSVARACGSTTTIQHLLPQRLKLCRCADVIHVLA